MLAITLPLHSLIAKPIRDGKLKSKKIAIPPKKFIDPSNMDLSVNPGNDFFKYANGNWIKQNTVPRMAAATTTSSTCASENFTRG